MIMTILTYVTSLVVILLCPLKWRGIIKLRKYLAKEYNLDVDFIDTVEIALMFCIAINAFNLISSTDWDLRIEYGIIFELIVIANGVYWDFVHEYKEFEIKDPNRVINSLDL